MIKFLKRFLLCIAILITSLLVVIGIAFHYLNGSPSYYRTYEWTSQERSRINADAVHKILAVQNKVAASHAAEIRKEPSTQPAIELYLSQEELNAFLIHNFSDLLSPWIKDPGIYLKNGQIILAGKMSGSGMDIVASAFFSPSITPDGKLNVKLDKTLGGRLALPDFIVNSQTTRVLNKINSSLPNLQKNAKMDSLGRCNTAFVQASIAQSMSDVLNQKPASPILFFPSDNGVSLPFKITAIDVKEEALKLTVEIPTPQDRAEIQKSITH